MDVESFIAENAALKMKLQSKVEALKILNQQLYKCKQERDRLSLIVENGAHSERETFEDPKPYSIDSINFTENRELITLNEKNKLLKLEVEDLKQRLQSIQSDMMVLRRDRTSNNRRESSQIENNVSWHQREELIQELEQTKARARDLSTDLQALLDEKEELVTERDAYRCKVHRLNHELNVLLKGNYQIDIDALVMENKYLKERCDQITIEKDMAMQSLSKYKAMLDKKKVKGNVKLGTTTTAGMIVTHKQVHELLEGEVWKSPYNVEATLSDLRSLSLALLDALQDKTTALTHQRRANKILADRVSNLEMRLAKDEPVYPSQCLLDGYTSSQVDKDLNVNSVKSSLLAESASLEVDQKQQQISAEQEKCINTSFGPEEDDVLPPKLQELVLKAMEELSHDNAVES